jgi:outer membrane protein W
MNFRINILLLTASLAASVVFAEDSKSCLVMTPDYSGDCTSATANLFTKHTIQLLNQSTSCKPMPVETAVRRLADADVALNRLPTRQAAVIAAGNVLKVQEVVHGSIAQTGNQFHVWLKLYDARTGMETKKAGASFTGTEQAMPAKVIPFLLDKLGISISTRPVPAAMPAETRIKVPPSESSASAPTPRGSRDTEITRGTAGPSPLIGHLEIGTRMMHYVLFKDSKQNFIGSIDRLDADQNYLPLKLYANWMFAPAYGLELSWDRVAAKTITSSTGYTDGTIVMKGPCLAFVARYPDTNPWQPFAGLGLAYLPGDFEAASWWHLGYPTPDEWEAAGSPSISNNEVTRSMEIKDEIGLLMMGGVQYCWDAAWSVDVYFRMLFADADTHYWIDLPGNDVKDRGTKTIPMDSWALGFGVRYSF